MNARLLMGLMVIGLAVVGCQAEVVSPTPVATSTIEPSATNTPTATVNPTATATPTATRTPTVTRTPRPTPQFSAPSLDCGEAGSLIFSRGYNIYLTCADGSAEQEIVPEEVWLPDWQHLRDFDLSPDGQKLAVSMYAKSYISESVDFEFGILTIDLTHGTIKEIYRTEDYVIDSISWSPDGNYIGYVANENYNSWIEVLHPKDRIISQVVTAEAITSQADRVVNMDDFDWSPDGARIAYATWVWYIDIAYGEYNGYIASIDCSPTTHHCTGYHQQQLDWVDSLRALAWSPDGRYLSTGYVDNAGASVIEIRTAEGWLHQRIDLGEYLPEMEISVGKPTLSPDGDRIVFVMDKDLFVMDLTTLEVIKAASRSSDAQWFSESTRQQ